MTLTARGVSVRHPGESGWVLPPTDVVVRRGAITALVGPSGIGKSTLTRVLAGIQAPDAGRVTRDGAPVGPHRGRLPGHTALLAQDPYAATDPRLTLRRTISLPARLRRAPVDVPALAREVGLDPALLTRRPHQVSGGQLHRACLARALAQRPDYLLADEVTAHLDPDATAAVGRVLRARASGGLGILLVTHDLRLAAALANEVMDLGAAA
ncbi:ABC transporter ATP-binding protein [Dietzia aurantiaca]|uniref:ABC transporter ATP-binding protein n=1 Tax=Dietzia aurantiaca TaxID=983873 RepID=A0ABV9PQW6_9ACTN